MHSSNGEVPFLSHGAIESHHCPGCNLLINKQSQKTQHYPLFLVIRASQSMFKVNTSLFPLPALFRSIFSLYGVVTHYIDLLVMGSSCRGGGKVGKRAVEQHYASVLAALMLQLGSCHSLAGSGQPEPLR